MIGISSHPKLTEFKMRVLIISAFFACAAAAPSGLVAPLVYQSVVVPAVVPTISPGDIQAAAIDAQVKLDDLAVAAADQAQLLADQAQLLADQAQNKADQTQNTADQASANADETSEPEVNLANEKNVEAFWSNEDKKWQTLDALKTAEAQIDGAVASNAAVYANAAVGRVVPYVAAAAPVAPVVATAPFAPLIYSPYVAAIKSVSTKTVEVKAEENKEEKQEAAEPEKVADTAVVKSADKAFVIANPIVTPYSSVYSVSAPALVAPRVLSYTSIHPAQTVLAPTYLRNVW